MFLSEMSVYHFESITETTFIYREILRNSMILDLNPFYLYLSNLNIL